MAYFFDNLKNNFDFSLRKNFSFSRKNYFESPENLEDINTFGLGKKYDLNLFQPSTRYNYKLNLYFLNVFDKYLSKNSFKNLSILDIGSKNWEYVKSEYLFFKSVCNDFILDGIELDSFRLNSRLFNRAEVAKFHTKDLLNANYISGDLLNHDKKYDRIIWILPFVTKYPLIRWGLPLKYFNPEKMLLHAYNLLNKDGEMLIINQGEEEYSIQQGLLSDLNIEYISLGEIEDKLKLFKNKRFCSKIIKD